MQGLLFIFSCSAQFGWTAATIFSSACLNLCKVHAQARTLINDEVLREGILSCLKLTASFRPSVRLAILVAALRAGLSSGSFPVPGMASPSNTESLHAQSATVPSSERILSLGALALHSRTSFTHMGGSDTFYMMLCSVASLIWHFALQSGAPEKKTDACRLRAHYIASNSSLASPCCA